MMMKAAAMGRQPMARLSEHATFVRTRCTASASQPAKGQRGWGERRGGRAASAAATRRRWTPGRARLLRCRGQQAAATLPLLRVRLQPATAVGAAPAEASAPPQGLLPLLLLVAPTVVKQLS